MTESRPLGSGSDSRSVRIGRVLYMHEDESSRKTILCGDKDPILVYVNIILWLYGTSI